MALLRAARGRMRSRMRAEDIEGNVVAASKDLRNPCVEKRGDILDAGPSPQPDLLFPALYPECPSLNQAHALSACRQRYVAQ